MSGEFFVNHNDSFKKVMYLIKQHLKDKTELTVKASISSSFTASSVAENLVRLNYVTYGSVTTTTEVSDGKRRIKLSINLKKTKDFDRLYEENEAKRKQILESRGLETKENK